ncbi:MAG: cation:proton antiporter, partial [Turicibacter sp.]
MLSYEFLFDIALILLSTKVLGLITKRVQLPQVVGALLAGLLLGPACFNVLHETDFLLQLAELGVIVLMFTAGLETDISELKKSGKASIIIAILGMIVPLVGGFAVASFFNKGGISDASAPILLQNIFIGIILTATSVSITVETLKELGKLSTRAGNAILGAAIIDDILGVIALTVVTSMTDTSVSIGVVLLKIVLFFVVGGGAAWIFSKLVERYMRSHDRDLRRYVILAFVFCLLLSFSAEHFFGVADITGAFMAGLMLSRINRKHYIMARFDTTAYMLLSPVFFASIGVKVVIPEMSATLILFSVVLLIVAIASKIIGCGLGAKIAHYTNKEAIQIGTGMVSRGEVALIVASKGSAFGLMGSVFFGPVVIMVVVTTIITPILLKIIFTEKHNK